MVTPSILTWVAHGSPVVDGCGPVVGGCYLCAGVMGRGLLVTDWMGPGFTSQTLARCSWANHICEACAYVTSRVSPVLTRDAKEGKKFGGNFRNYSHCFDECGYFNASKGEKPLLRAFLGREHSAPWFCAVADSGQKHVLPFVRLNGPGRAGLVLMDEQTIEVPMSSALVDAMTTLLTSGVTKDEISTRNYYQRSWMERRTEVEAFETQHGAGRGGGWFTLALWLAQRDEEEHARRQSEKEARDSSRGIGARAAKRIPERAGGPPANELLGANGEPHARGRSPDSERKRVGKPDAAAPPDRKPAQGRLFGVD